VSRTLVVPIIVLLVAGCATPAPAPRPYVNASFVEECRNFAEQTVPVEPMPVRGTNFSRSAVYPSRNPESLRTLFDLCLQAKEALR
jgi:hypothetical protein